MSKTVLIIGGSRGIGKTTALRFLKDSWRVLATYCNNKPDYDDSFPESQCIFKQLDVTKSEAFTDLFEFIKQKCPEMPDVFIYNAGISKPIMCLQNSREELRSMLEVNLIPAVDFMRKAAESLIPLRKKCKIFFISSISGSKTGRGHVNYAIAKSGLETLVRVGAIEFSRSGILVNAIAPGVIETDMSKSFLEQMKTTGRKKEFMDLIAMKRIGQPEEIANILYALSQEEIDYITGQVIHVDGGFQL